MTIDWSKEEVPRADELTRLRARVERLEAACRKLIVCAEMVADCDAGEDDEQPASKSARAAIKAAREALEDK